jgi:glycosyltransferase involved in cell wall biosynthesis
LLHVGGGQWYKNFRGVLAIYSRYAALVEDPMPLWCVGPEPRGPLRQALTRVPARGKVVFVKNLKSAALQALYSCSSALLFPSLAEGFGWPLIEAQACGCPVLTTAEPPMNEVAGDSACYIPRLLAGADLDAWSLGAANALCALLCESPAVKQRRREAGRAWAQRFDSNSAIDGYLAVYNKVRNLSLAQCDVAARLNGTPI